MCNIRYNNSLKTSCQIDMVTGIVLSFEKDFNGLHYLVKSR